jgi:uncharacterized protein (TIGR00369 family)
VSYDYDHTLRWFNELPLSQILGARCVHLSHGTSRATLTADSRLVNPNGAVPGATLAAFADLVGGMAVATVSRADEYFATLHLSLQFARAGFGRDYSGHATVVRRASRHTFVRIEVFDAEDRLCVAADGTWVMFPDSAHAFSDPTAAPPVEPRS